MPFAENGGPIDREAMKRLRNLIGYDSATESEKPADQDEFAEQIKQQLQDERKAQYSRMASEIESRLMSEKESRQQTPEDRAALMAKYLEKY